MREIAPTLRFQCQERGYPGDARLALLVEEAEVAAAANRSGASDLPTILTLDTVLPSALLQPPSLVVDVTVATRNGMEGTETPMSFRELRVHTALTLARQKVVRGDGDALFSGRVRHKALITAGAMRNVHPQIRSQMPDYLDRLRRRLGTHLGRNVLDVAMLEDESLLGPGVQGSNLELIVGRLAFQEFVEVELKEPVPGGLERRALSKYFVKSETVVDADAERYLHFLSLHQQLWEQAQTI
jgi:hypothetical protein